MKLFVILVLASSLLFSCGGKNVDVNTLEGKATSLAANDTSIFLIVAADLDNIIQKSGAFDGALPGQYVSFITPYKDALFQSVNLDSPVYFFVKGPVVKDSPDEMILLFDIKDVEKLKNEFKQMDLKFSGNEEFSFAANNEIGVAISDNKFGVIVFSPDGVAISEQKLKDINTLSTQNVTDEKLLASFKTKADIVIIAPLVRVSQSMNELELSKETKANVGNSLTDSYVITTMNFVDDEAEMTIDFMFGEEMKKYLPLFDKKASPIVLNSLGYGSPIFAMTMNFEFSKLFLSLWNNIDPNDMADVNQALAMVGGKDKVAQMFTGEVGVAILQPKENEKNPVLNGYLGLNDGSYLKTLINSFGPIFGMNTDENGNYQFKNDAIIQLDNSKMILSTDVAGFPSLLSGSSSKITLPSSLKFGEKAISLFVDFTKIDPDFFSKSNQVLTEELSYLFLEGDDTGIKLVLKTKNNGKNILRQLLEQAVKSIELNIDTNEDPFDDSYMTDDELDEFYSF